MGGRGAVAQLAGLLVTLVSGLLDGPALGPSAWSAPLPPDPCPPLEVQRPVALAQTAGDPPLAPTVPLYNPDDYRHRLRPTPLGWARLESWCVWVEPGASEGPAALWDGRWRQAVDGALASWKRELQITVVVDPNQAQIHLLRRKPPLQNGRASHGRAELVLMEVRRGQLGQAASPWLIEPQVLVQLSPGQGVQAMQATALHELGHAFGLWGHSDQPGDALAMIPGSRPVLALSPRDRATFRWLQQQPGLKRSSAPGTALPPDSPH